MYYTSYRLSKKQQKLRTKMERLSKQSNAKILELRCGIKSKPGVGSREQDFVAHPIKSERRTARQLKAARREFSLLRLSQEYKEWFAKQEMVCRYCKEVVTQKTLAIDHIIPLVRWGANDITNLCIACRECNGRKHDKIYIEDIEKEMKKI